MTWDARLLVLILGTLLLTALLAPRSVEARGGRGRGGQAGRGGGQVLETRFEAIEIVPLTEQEIAEVTYLLEEEKLARDVYRTLGKKWSLPIFTNIGAAEQRHMNHVRLIFALYELPDPVTDDTAGVFANPVLDALYDELVAKGSATLVDALQVGARIEDLDIADLEDLLGLSTNGHVRLVAQNLIKGSRNHLRAFMRALANRGATYVPEHLSPDAFAAILAGAQERGPVDENGRSLNGRSTRGEGACGRGRGHGQREARGRGGRNRSCDGSGRQGEGRGRQGEGRGRQGEGRGRQGEGRGRGGRGGGRNARGNGGS